MRGHLYQSLCDRAIRFHFTGLSRAGGNMQVIQVARDIYRYRKIE